MISDCRDRLVVLAASILRDPHEAEDVVQETTLAVWGRLGSIAPDKVEHYLNRAVRRNAARRAALRRRHRSSVTALDPQTIPAASHREPDPIEIEDAIDHLPLIQQTALRMRFHAGMTFREIGETLSISTNTAASRCRYAITRLRRLFGSS